jgi:flagellin-like protein
MKRKMRTKSRKALSPVIASIILIAVTVAVSIAVAAWMGALSFSFMNSGEQLQLGSPYGWSNGSSIVNLVASCPGGNAWTISSVRINGNPATVTGSPSLGPIAAQSSAILTINYTGNTFKSSYSYTIVVVTAKNNEYQTTGMCP